MLKNRGGLVYSTESGRTCPTCRKALSACICKQSSVKPVGDGIVRVFRETKGRRGKTATVIEVQGDHCDKVIALLISDGFTVKRAGG
jgi:translation initiation factor 1